MPCTYLCFYHADWRIKSFLRFILHFIIVLWRLNSTANWHALHERNRASRHTVGFTLDDAYFGSFTSVDIVTSTSLLLRYIVR
jgi:hypothetical protein